MKDRCEDEITLRRTSRQGAGRPKKATEPEPPRIPRVARLMALAIKFQEMIDHGEVNDHADLARLGFVTRARLTQIMNLTLLAPDIQEQILRGAVAPESSIRLVVRWVDWASQRQIWRSASVKTSNLA
ncbi:MAG: hypothetical protein IT165_05585 [Bryobacterales bacterium]|nr:hypothetical protein [Bryobacterales bacterium]